MAGPSTLGRRLKAFRERAGLSQNELAKRAGVHRPAISLLESGEQDDIAAQSALAIAKALGVTLDVLMQDDPLTDEASPPPAKQRRRVRASV